MAGMSDDVAKTLGRPVPMPEHNFDIESGLLGSLVDGFKNGSGYEQDFRAQIETGDRTFRSIAEAVAQASERIMFLTEFGRELGSEEERDQADELYVYTPDYASGPCTTDGEVYLTTDWKGEIPQEAADACLAVLVQELQAAGIGGARITRPNHRDSPRPFRRDTTRSSCTDPDRGRRLGRNVVLPDHPYDVDPQLLDGPVDSRTDHQQCFDFRVEGGDSHLRSIAEALDRASSRLGWITEFGRELGLDDVTEADSIDLFAPNFGGVTKWISGGLELGGRHTGKQPPEFSRACLAVVVQELLASNVPSAGVGFTLSEQRLRSRREQL